MGVEVDEGEEAEEEEEASLFGESGKKVILSGVIVGEALRMVGEGIDKEGRLSKEIDGRGNDVGVVVVVVEASVDDVAIELETVLCLRQQEDKLQILAKRDIQVVETVDEDECDTDDKEEEEVVVVEEEEDGEVGGEGGEGGEEEEGYSRKRAIPKSPTLRHVSSTKKRFSGERSRCATPE